MQAPSDNVPQKTRLTSWLQPNCWARKSGKAPSILPTSSDVSVEKGEAVNKLFFQSAGDAGRSDRSKSLKNGRPGAISSNAVADNEKHTTSLTGQRHIASRFCKTTYTILAHSWFHVLLVFLPAGITLHFMHAQPLATFLCNAFAILPLANLLTVGTESLAKRLGNTYGALVNVSMGNCVELIIFIIAVYKNELRIVQASLIGSILANLLFIFGLSVFLGGLKYKEQVYNSNVSQMSAVLLGLSVLTLLLPTAFYNAFKQTEIKQANKAMLKFSRGTSFVLLAVYATYLYFQLRSHKHLYVGTPQHVLDEEAAAGPLAEWFESSSDSSSSGSDSDESSASSEGAVARLQKIIKRRGKRNNSSESSRCNGAGGTTNASSFITPDPHPGTSYSPGSSPTEVGGSPISGRTVSFGTKLTKLDRKERKRQKKAKKKEKKERRRAAKKAQELQRLCDEADKAKNEAEAKLKECRSKSPVPPPLPSRTTFFVDFAERTLGTAGRRFGSDRDEPVKSGYYESRPALLRAGLRQPTPETTLRPPRSAIPHHIPGVYSAHRSDTLPSSNFTRNIRHSNELARTSSSRSRAPTVAYPPYAEHGSTEDTEENDLSKVGATTLLITSTILVALCAYGLVDTIEEVTKSGGKIPEAFVGLIIVPLVGNAAEHFTAVRMAQHNKMDLTIGIAVGSSIQIGASTFSSSPSPSPCVLTSF